MGLEEVADLSCSGCRICGAAKGHISSVPLVFGEETYAVRSIGSVQFVWKACVVEAKISNVMLEMYIIVGVCMA